MKEYEFDFDEVLKEFRNGKKLTGNGGLLAPLIKQLTEAALETWSSPGREERDTGSHSHY